MFRFISIFIRKTKSRKGKAKVLKQFLEWKKQLENFKAPDAYLKLLIIRLDDIGDYILFRNFLKSYKNSERWKKYSITLLGNLTWKELFDLHDIGTVDATIWVDKKQYFDDESYRSKIWNELRNQNFETVICPSRTRQLLLDDICTLVTGTKHAIGSVNTTFHTSWNEPSDKIYTELFKISNEGIHEFYFNKQFTEWCCKTLLDETTLQIKHKPSSKEKYIVCFIGVSTKSRQWPLQNWTKFIKAVLKNYNYKILISGAKNDITMANKIAVETGAFDIAGKTTLSELTDVIGNAELVVTNDTLAVHLAAACNTKTIILSNGNNFYRFTEYQKAEFKNVCTLYSKPFLKALQTRDFAYLKKNVNATKDMFTIKSGTVLKLMDKMIKVNY